MAIETKLAETATKGVMERLGAWLDHAGAVLKGTIKGEAIDMQRTSMVRGTTLTHFNSGMFVLTRPGKEPLVRLPKAWVEEFGNHGVPGPRALREGSWVTSVNWSAATNVEERTLANGIKVAATPGKAMHVKLTPALLNAVKGL